MFANFDVADMPVNVKAGQHTVYWGDSLLLGGAIHGVSYAQNSLDVWKGFATPGTEAKELFRPKGGVTVQAQATKDLSVAAQWFYNWQAIRMPESGSYLTVNDGLNFGGDSLIVGANPFAAAVPGSPALLRAWNTQAVAPSRYSGSLGDWGLSARWSPEWLDGTLGFYYRNATDIQPQVVLTPGLRRAARRDLHRDRRHRRRSGRVHHQPRCDQRRRPDPEGQVRHLPTAYGDNIHIYGITLAKNIGGVSVGAEFSYRQNMPLLSDPVQVLPAPLVPNVRRARSPPRRVPTSGTPGALGDTYHAHRQRLGTIPKTPLFDSATYQAELTWMRWAKVTQNEAVFKGRDGYNRRSNKVSRDFVGLAINFTPTWFQVFPGVDLLAPISWSQGLSGNAAVFARRQRGRRQLVRGHRADIYSKYRIDLKYTGYFGNYSTNPATGRSDGFNGFNAILSDRGWARSRLKATF